MGKLINRIPGSRLLISSLPGSALRMHVESLGIHCYRADKTGLFIDVSTRLHYLDIATRIDIQIIWLIG